MVVACFQWIRLSKCCSLCEHTPHPGAHRWLELLMCPDHEPLQMDSWFSLIIFPFPEQPSTVIEKNSIFKFSLFLLVTLLFFPLFYFYSPLSLSLSLCLSLSQIFICIQRKKKDYMQIDTNKFQMFSNIMRWCKRKQNIYEMKQCLMVHYISLKNDRCKT